MIGRIFDKNKFFLGRLCPHDHSWSGFAKSLRYKSTGDCVECKKLANKRYFKTWWKKLKQENPEKAKAHSIAWQKRNPEKARTQQKQWRKRNPEKVKAYSKKYRENKSDDYKIYQHEYYIKKLKKN